MKKLIFLLAYLFLTLPCAAEIIIVDDDWPYDFNNIQAAIDYSSGFFDYIVVFPGTYTGPGNYDIDFQGKSITVQSVAPTDPYIVAATVIDCNGLGGGFGFLNGGDANSVLAGLTIKNGVKAEGGGIYCYNSSPTIINCTITGCWVGFRGGGICCREQSNPTITDCTIIGNVADAGGGVYCRYNSNPTITNCTITGNSVIYDGGGVSCEEMSDPIITNCTITGNFAEDNGGGIYSGPGSDPIITNCVITGNAADGEGGGIWCEDTMTTITNCTITGNLAGYDGGGIFCGADLISINGCIVWSNANIAGLDQYAQICYYGDTDVSNVWFSCIQDDDPNDSDVPFGTAQNNIDDDPCFVEPGYWADANDPNIVVEPNDPNAVWLDGDYHLLLTSPCVDTGDPYFTYDANDVDMDNQPRLMGRYVDIGADEVDISVIVVTKPKGGEVWAAGSMHEINWDSYDITGTVDIYCVVGALVHYIGNNVPDVGSYTWHIPSDAPPDFYFNQGQVSVAPNTPVASFVSIPSGFFTIQPYSPGPPVVSKWKSLGGDFDRTGLSENFGPELGCIKWQFQMDGPVSASPSIGANGRVHLPCEDGNLYTLDANGMLLWSYDTNSPLLSSPSIGPDGTLFVGAENGKLYAIDVNGNLRWVHSTDGFIYSSPAVAADGNIYACSQDGTLYALGQDGSELWSFETGGVGVATGAVFASPAVGPNNTVYISGFYDSNLYALDSDDGSIKWSCTFSDPCEPNGPQPWQFASPVVAADGTVYVSLLLDPNLYAVDPNDGSVIWSANLADPCYSCKYSWSEPALGPDGTIYVSFDDPYLRAIEPNGNIKWATPLGMVGGFTLTVGSDGLIYAASNDAYLCVIDPNGAEIARFKGGHWLSFPVITEDNAMIVSDANNTVWAIGGDDCEGQSAALHRPQDLSADWTVNLEDFALIANDWLKLNCFTSDEVPPCEEYPEDGFYYMGDVDRNLYVDFADVAELADKWLNEE